jgi:hypothetical protein
MNGLFNLEDIKNEWAETHSNEVYTSLEKFIRNNFTPVYNGDFDFLGWQRGSLFPEFKE